MNEERKAWEQMEREPDLWYGRFVKFMRLGTKRSVNAVCQKETKKTKENARTNAGIEWYEAAKQWAWAERVRQYDEHQRAEEDRIITEEREKVLRSGYALMHKRVRTLDRLARKLEQMEKDDRKIWLTETRTTNMGEGKSVIIEKVTFNHQPYVLIDKFFDSIAKEVGDRVKREQVDVTNINDKDIQSLHDAIEKALEQFPEAKQALAEELAELNNEQ